MFKRIFLFMFLAIASLGCSQKHDEPNVFLPSKNNLTSENYLAMMTKVIKHYPQEPYYFLKISDIAGCSYEIYINDIPVFSYYGDGTVSTELDVQKYIAKSGPQKITYKLYPIAQSETGNVIPTTLVDWTEMKITLFTIDKREKSPDSSEKLITKFHSPTTANGHSFIAAGQKYYENSFTFDVQLPFENKYLSNSTDLRKMDQDKLLEKTVSAYNKLRQLIREHKKDEFFSYLYTKEAETSQSEYRNKKELQVFLNDYLSLFSNETYETQPLENYKMKLYGDGRIVCLEQSSLDPRFRGQSSLWGKYKDKDGTKMASFSPIYLHIPKGKTEFEIIR